jgi:parallel beta-helix repeat protein
MLGGGDNTVVDNEITDSLGPGVMVGEELLPSNNSRVERNTIEGANGGGISVVDSDGVVVVENEVRDAGGAGVTLEMSDNALVRANDVRGNQGGIVVDESAHNQIESNNASGGLGSGIEVGALSPDNDIVINIANDNGGEGIQIEDSALIGQGTLVEGNETSGNGGNGIGLEGVGHIVADNTANQNGGWGIYAAVGAIDRGGNKAGGNMEPDQCYGVVCNAVTIPGAPETWIVDKPSNPSNSRNASFTYLGSDSQTPITELVFECRIDSDDPFAWEDCEYPAEYRNLSAGPHTFEVRAIDQLGAGLADQTPARAGWRRVRVGLRGDRGRPAHVLRARDRLRGQRRRARHLHVAAARDHHGVPARAEPRVDGLHAA